MIGDHGARLVFAFGHSHGVTLLLDFIVLVLVVYIPPIVRLISACQSLWRRRGAVGGPNSRRRTSGDFYVDYRPVCGEVDASAASSGGRQA